jgi:hypothetical protein
VTFFDSAGVVSALDATTGRDVWRNEPFAQLRERSDVGARRLRHITTFRDVLAIATDRELVLLDVKGSICGHYVMPRSPSEDIAFLRATSSRLVVVSAAGALSTWAG